MWHCDTTNKSRNLAVTDNSCQLVPNSINSSSFRNSFVSKSSSSINKGKYLIASVKTKSVSFNEKQEIFLIPSRKDITSNNISSRRREISGIETVPDDRKLQSSFKVKELRFQTGITNFPVPSRDDLKSMMNELWYNAEEILSMERRALKALKKYLNE